MSDLWNNDYSSAGPGAKRRERLTLETIPRKIAKTKAAKPEYRRNLKPRKHADEKLWNGNPIDITNKITLLTLQIGSFGQIVDRLELEAYGPASKVMVANIRNKTMKVLRVMMDEGLISQKVLDRYRADAKEQQRKRFKRERLDDD